MRGTALTNLKYNNVYTNTYRYVTYYHNNYVIHI